MAKKIVKKPDDRVCLNVKIFGNVVVGAKGQIVIPNEVRKLMDLKTGDSLIVTTKHGKAIGLIKADDLEEFVAMMQEELAMMKKLNTKNIKI